jgi:hypothetical protein
MKDFLSPRFKRKLRVFQKSFKQFGKGAVCTKSMHVRCMKNEESKPDLIIRLLLEVVCDKVTGNQFCTRDPISDNQQFFGRILGVEHEKQGAESGR